MAYDEELNRMAMAPEDRYVSAIDLGDDIACWLAKRPVTARPTTASRDRVADPAIWSGQKKVVTVRPMPGSISMRSVTKGEIFSAAPTQGRLRTPGGGTRPGSPHISRGSGNMVVKRRSLRDGPEGTESPENQGNSENPPRPSQIGGIVAWRPVGPLWGPTRVVD